jgi:hypothetical protein
LSYSPRPHVSAALAHLRVSVTACAVALGLALVGQVVVWATVHYTDARLTDVAPASDGREGPLVVKAPAKPAASSSRSPEALGAIPSLAEANHVPGERDAVLRRIAGFVQAVGVIASVLLAALMMQGVFLAGATAVPGVERAVSAASVAMVIALVCLPLSGLLPGVAFRGVFGPYAELVEASGRVRSGGPDAPPSIVFFGAFLVMPAAVLAALLQCVFRFRSGIEQGYIVTSVSEIEEKLEREIRSMKTGQLAVPRAVGALNMALGAPVAEPSFRAAAGAESMRVAPPAFLPQGEAHGYSLKPGDSTKRPI